MKKYVVEITDEALADMEQIYDYIASVLQVPENAMRQYNRIAYAIVTNVLYSATNIEERLECYE